MLDILKYWIVIPFAKTMLLPQEFATGRILRCQKRESDGTSVRYSILKESRVEDRYKWQIYDYYPGKAELILRFRCVKYEDAVRGYEAIVSPNTDNDWSNEFLS